MIKKESLDSLQESLNIIDIVSKYIDVKKSGTSFKARCPFHNEKTPSFIISPQKQMFHCFGCGVGGNAITFVRDIENISFVDAVESLAERYGFQLEYDNQNKKHFDKLPILQTINDWFIEKLHSNNKAYNYLTSRGLTKSSIEKFQLGYAPSSYELLDFLKEKNINFQEVESLGVIALNENYGDYYNRFQERIIFPIFSQNGKIIAFGGRTISNHPAKYINSPTTPIFNKSKTFYGYNFAKKSIYQTNEVHVVEGYLDVIMLSQVGIENIVAPLGTALTTEHTYILKRDNIKVNLAFDGDKAGFEATKRALDVLMPVGIESSISLFRDGIDPADLVKDGKIEIVKNILNSSKDAIKFYLEEIIKKYNLGNPFDKNRAVSETKGVISKLPRVLKDEYSRYLEEVLSLQTPAMLLKSGKINTRERENKNEFIGYSELSILRSIIDNNSLLTLVLNYIDENYFKYNRNAFLDIINGDLKSQNLKRIAVMDCNIFTKNELQSELINYKLRELSVKRKTVLDNKKMPFSEKNFQFREIQHNLISLKKERLHLDRL